MDISMMTIQELEEKLSEVYEKFETVKNECYDKFLEMGKIQEEYDEIDREIKKRNGRNHEK